MTIALKFNYLQAEEYMRSLSDFFFNVLNAPLKNKQWSWGAENGNGVYLRVWKSELDGNNGLVYVDSPSDRRLGQLERQSHIQTIMQGKPGYAVLIDGEQSQNGIWRISGYDSNIYPIIAFCTVDKEGRLFAKIDLAQPIYPENIGQEIDVIAIQQAANQNIKAQEKLTKAMHEFGWKPTRLDNQNGVIYLISRDGKNKAKLIISSAEWLR